MRKVGLVHRITLVCHAATAASRNAALPDDEGLDERGRAATAAMAGGFGRVDRAWCGPERRTRETGLALGLEATEDLLLRARSHGAWSGRPIADAAASDGEAALGAYLSDPGFAPPGGESLLAVCGRASAWLGRATDRDAGGHEVAVCHAEFMRVVVTAVLGAPAASFRAIDVGPLTQIVLTRSVPAGGARAPSESWRLRAVLPASGFGRDRSGGSGGDKDSEAHWSAAAGGGI